MLRFIYSSSYKKWNFDLFWFYNIFVLRIRKYLHHWWLCEQPRDNQALPLILSEYPLWQIFFQTLKWRILSLNTKCFHIYYYKSSQVWILVANRSVVFFWSICLGIENLMLHGYFCSIRLVFCTHQSCAAHDDILYPKHTCNSRCAVSALHYAVRVNWRHRHKRCLHHHVPSVARRLLPLTQLLFKPLTAETSNTLRVHK